MKPKHQRLVIISFCVGCLSLATLLTIDALREHVVYFYLPSDPALQQVSSSKLIRVGGLVSVGSLNRAGQEVTFQITDQDQTVTVAYDGIVPDLFAEGKGVIAEGYLQESGQFKASMILAKHDENYMPPDVAKALEAKGHKYEAS
ncbi:MAG: cytochrome c maturation protein CcmE [Alphaproteobacteria bacterium]